MAKKGLFFITAAVLLFALIFGIERIANAAESTARPRQGGILKIADHRSSMFLGYPQKMVQGYYKRQATPVIENLFRLDKSGQAVPWLATGWKADGSGRIITLTLRRGVKFHDGTDFNAEAVK